MEKNHSVLSRKLERADQKLEKMSLLIQQCSDKLDRMQTAHTWSLVSSSSTAVYEASRGLMPPPPPPPSFGNKENVGPNLKGQLMQELVKGTKLKKTNLMYVSY